MSERITEIEALIIDWVDAQQALVEAKERVNKCQCALSNAENALGKAVTPKDAQAQEVFTIPIPQKEGAPKYLQVCRKSDTTHINDYSVYWRDGRKK